jgi:hypothetical protein
MFVHEVNFYHSRVVDTTDFKKLDAIFKLRIRLAFISRLKPERYPAQVLIIAKDLCYILPFKPDPQYYEQIEKLKIMLESCRENIKAQKPQLA